MWPQRKVPQIWVNRRRQIQQPTQSTSGRLACFLMLNDYRASLLPILVNSVTVTGPILSTLEQVFSDERTPKSNCQYPLMVEHYVTTP